MSGDNRITFRGRGAAIRDQAHDYLPSESNLPFFRLAISEPGDVDDPIEGSKTAAYSSTVGLEALLGQCGGMADADGEGASARVL